MKSYSRRIKLVLFHRDESGRPTAYLVRRPKSNDGQGTKKWPGVVLATLGCKPKDGEDDLAALVRLLNETSKGRLGVLGALTLLELLTEDGPDGNILHVGESATIYGLTVSPEIIRLIYPELSDDAFVRVTAKDLHLLTNANDANRFDPPADDKIIVFSHLRSALETALRGRPRQTTL